MGGRVGIAVVGLGEWGSSLARHFAQQPGADLRWICDRDTHVLARAVGAHGGAHATADVRRVLDDRRVEAVVIATPLATHAQLARDALAAGKDVLVQPPLVFSSEDAADLADLAADGGQLLVTGHSVLFHPAMQFLKESVDAGELGDVHYLYGNRQNLGGVRADANVLWSLGPEHVAAVLHLVEQEPLSVSVNGGSYVESGGADVAFCHLRFDDGITVNLHLSWLEAESVRKLTVVASERMVVFDELDTARALTVYEKGPQHGEPSRRGLRFQPGKIVSPSVRAGDPLELEAASFVAAIRQREDLAGRALLGLRVVSILEALERSLENGGADEPVAVQEHAGTVLHFGRALKAAGPPERGGKVAPPTRLDG